MYCERSRGEAKYAKYAKNRIKNNFTSRSYKYLNIAISLLVLLQYNNNNNNSKKNN